MKAEIFLEILLLILGLYLAFFKSYFTEKGKNLATSEDIEELTNKVELVKQKFIEKNSSLKAKLDLLTNLQIGHKNDERTSLIEMHRSISKWINLLIGSINLVDSYNNTEIDKKLFDYNETYNEVQASQAILKLYVEDKELHQLTHDLIIKVLEELASHPTTAMINLKSNNSYLAILEKSPDSEEKVAKNKELMEKRTEIHSVFNEKKVEGYKEVVNLQKSYEEKTRELLKKFLTE